MTSTLIGRQAVVVGAGMAGLPAARALSDYFEHIVVLERDTLPFDASYRAGTPQARHTHALLGGGLQALGNLFPGFDRDLAGNGAVPLNVGLDVRIERPGFDPFPQRDFGVPSYAVSRPLIELTLRQRVGQNDNITIRERCRAYSILTSDDGTAVSAIRFENSKGQSETLEADLVIEASGRGNLTLALLKTIGLTAPEESVIGVDIGYATAIFAIPDDAPAAWKGVMTLDTLARGGLVGTILPLERNRWIVTLVGRHGDKPPGDRDSFLAYARQLRTPTIYEAIKGLEQFGEIARFNFPTNLRRHFERLQSFPRGLLPFGDAICRFNPVYGQGMTVAAQEACLLHDLLNEHSGDSDPFAGLTSAFFAKAAMLIETPWTLAAIPDFAHPETKGQPPEDLAQRLGFAEALNHLAAQDAAVHKLLVEVLHLLKPGSVLNDPALVDRVKALAQA